MRIDYLAGKDYSAAGKIQAGIITGIILLRNGTVIPQIPPGRNAHAI